MIVCVSAQNSLSSADNQELLDAHNMFRGMVNPPATNMLRMVRYKYISIMISFAANSMHWIIRFKCVIAWCSYDNSLAKLISNWSLQCYTHILSLSHT